MTGFIRVLTGLAGIGLLLGGAALLIAGQSGLLPASLLGVSLDPAVPGVVVGAVGLFLLLRSRRAVKDDGRDDDPEAHLTSIREVRDAAQDRD